MKKIEFQFTLFGICYTKIIHRCYLNLYFTIILTTYFATFLFFDIYIATHFVPSFGQYLIMRWSILEVGCVFEIIQYSIRLKIWTNHIHTTLKLKRGVWWLTSYNILWCNYICIALCLLDKLHYVQFVKMSGKYFIFVIYGLLY